MTRRYTKRMSTSTEPAHLSRRQFMLELHAAMHAERGAATEADVEKETRRLEDLADSRGCRVGLDRRMPEGGWMHLRVRPTTDKEG